MATYIKGADAYLPDIKPFTPDYKFLSQVVNARQDKYDANFQATNDLYNKVVYADLSRQDTKDRRDQYAQQIGPQIEKISGLDLSLQSNADAAKSVFAPFYQDDLTVRDVVFTSRFRDESKYANLLLDNPNKEQYEKYWDTGKKGLQYKMQNFVNASEEEAMNMPLPKYVEDADLAILADKILSEMDPPLKRKVDYFENDKNGRPLTDFIITEQNGKQVTGQAEQILRNQLMQNPKVIAAYYEEGFVRATDFASEGVSNGTFSSIAQGKEAWANETVKRINDMNTKDTQDNIKKKQKLVNANVNWQNYQANVGILEGPDSVMELAYQDQQSMLEATEAALDSNLQMREVSNLPVNTNQALMNQAYNLVMNYNILGDINKSARDYASRDYEYSIRESKYGVEKKRAGYASALQSQRDRAADDRQERKYQLEYLKGVAEGTIMSPEQQNMIDIMSGSTTTFGGSDTNEFPSDGDGVDDDFDPYELNSTQFSRVDNKVHTGQVTDIVDIYTTAFPSGNMGDQVNNYAIKDNEGNILFEGTPEKLRLQMNAVDEDGLFINRELVDTVFDGAVDILKDRKQMILDNPNLSESSEQYNDLYNRVISNSQSTVNKINGIDAVLKENTSRIAEHYNAVDSYLQNSSKGGFEKQAVNGRAAGLGSILKPDGNIMTKKKFIEQTIELVKAGQVTNWDAKGIDGNQSVVPLFGQAADKNYMNTIKTVTGLGEFTDISYAPGLDIDAIESDAGKYYDVYYDAMKASAKGDKKYGSLPPISFRGLLEGRGGAIENAYANPSVKFNLNPIVKLSPELQAQNDLAIKEFFGQLNSFKGRPFGILAGDLNKRGNDENSLMKKDATAVKVLDMWRSDYAEYLANPQDNPDKPIPKAQLIYKKVLGTSEDGDKTDAGWQVIFDAEWLASKGKGGVNNQYGALGYKEMEALKGIVPEAGDFYGEKESKAFDKSAQGISIVFPQDADLSQYSVNNQYYSYVETEILNSPNDTYTQVVPGELNPTAEFQIVKDGDNLYRMMYKAYNYNPYNPTDKSGGNYIPETGNMRISFPKGFSSKELDKKVELQKLSYERLREKNKTLFNLDKNRYGIKGSKNSYLPNDTIVKDNRPVIKIKN